MKNLKNRIAAKSIFFLLLVAPVIFTSSGCKKATEYEKDNIYDRNYKGTRSGGFTMTNSIVHETQTNDGLIGDGEIVYYKVVLTATGPDPISYSPSVSFKHNYTGSGMTFSQSASGPSGDLVNGFLIEPGTVVFPTYGTISGKAYSFRIGKAASWVTSGTQITVSCIVSDSEGNATTVGTFVATVQ